MTSRPEIRVTGRKDFSQDFSHLFSIFGLNQQQPDPRDSEVREDHYAVKDPSGDEALNTTPLAHEWYDFCNATDEFINAALDDNVRQPFLG